ncbi:MAG: hypothetical protein KKE01_00005, partial [Candidatus Omnitrophica bacterium]|nr:hypothetical protein [Candidatus Omnitrophota bacterium]
RTDLADFLLRLAEGNLAEHMEANLSEEEAEKFHRLTWLIKRGPETGTVAAEMIYKIAGNETLNGLQVFREAINSGKFTAKERFLIVKFVAEAQERAKKDYRQIIYALSVVRKYVDSSDRVLSKVLLSDLKKKADEMSANPFYREHRQAFGADHDSYMKKEDMSNWVGYDFKNIDLDNTEETRRFIKVSDALRTLFGQSWARSKILDDLNGTWYQRAQRGLAPFIGAAKDIIGRIIETPLMRRMPVLVRALVLAVIIVFLPVAVLAAVAAGQTAAETQGGPFAEPDFGSGAAAGEFTQMNLGFITGLEMPDIEDIANIAPEVQPLLTNEEAMRAMLGEIETPTDLTSLFEEPGFPRMPLLAQTPELAVPVVDLPGVNPAVLPDNLVEVSSGIVLGDVVTKASEPEPTEVSARVPSGKAEADETPPIRSGKDLPDAKDITAFQVPLALSKSGQFLREEIQIPQNASYMQLEAGKSIPVFWGKNDDGNPVFIFDVNNDGRVDDDDWNILNNLHRVILAYLKKGEDGVLHTPYLSKILSKKNLTPREELLRRLLGVHENLVDPDQGGTLYSDIDMTFFYGILTRILSEDKDFMVTRNHEVLYRVLQELDQAAQALVEQAPNFLRILSEMEDEEGNLKLGALTLFNLVAEKTYKDGDVWYLRRTDDPSAPALVLSKFDEIFTIFVEQEDILQIIVRLGTGMDVKLFDRVVSIAVKVGYRDAAGKVKYARDIRKDGVYDSAGNKLTDMDGDGLGAV